MKCSRCEVDDGLPTTICEGRRAHSLLSDCLENISARVAKLEPKQECRRCRWCGEPLFLWQTEDGCKDKPVPIADPPRQRKCEKCGAITSLESNYDRCRDALLCYERQLSAAIARAERAEAANREHADICYNRLLDLKNMEEQLDAALARAETAEASLRKIVEAGREWFDRWEACGRQARNSNQDFAKLICALRPYMTQEAGR